MDVHYGKPRNVFLTLDPFEILEYLRFKGFGKRRREMEAKLETIWKDRIEKIQREFVDYEVDVNSWLRTSSNLLELAPSNLDLYKYGDVIHLPCRSCVIDITTSDILLFTCI